MQKPDILNTVECSLYLSWHFILIEIICANQSETMFTKILSNLSLRAINQLRENESCPNYFIFSLVKVKERNLDSDWLAQIISTKIKYHD